LYFYSNILNIILQVRFVYQSSLYWIFLHTFEKTSDSEACEGCHNSNKIDKDLLADWFMKQ